jgi:hypothetical protein
MCGSAVSRILFIGRHAAAPEQANVVVEFANDLSNGWPSEGPIDYGGSRLSKS